MISSDTRAVLEGYAWPGNVRQLENALAHAVAATSAGTEILPSALPEEIRSAAETVTEPVDLATLPYREVLAHSRDQSSKEYLIALLKSVQGRAQGRAGLRHRRRDEHVPRLRQEPQRVTSRESPPRGARIPSSSRGSEIRGRSPFFFPFVVSRRTTRALPVSAT